MEAPLSVARHGWAVGSPGQESTGPGSRLAPICRASAGQALEERRARGNENKHKRAGGKERGAAASAPWQPMKGSDTMRNVFPSAGPRTGVGYRALRMARPQQGPGGTGWTSIGGRRGGGEGVGLGSKSGLIGRKDSPGSSPVPALQAVPGSACLHVP